MIKVIHEKTFNEYFEKKVKEFGGMPCLTNGETGEVLTFEELNCKVNQAANLLIEFGIKRGDRFATIMKNCPEFFFFYLASMKLGTLIVPMAVDLPAKKIANDFNRIGITLAIVDEENYSKIESAKNELKHVKVFTVNGKNNINNELSKMSADASGINFPLISTPGSLYFSSGTTGKPKGIPQSPKNLLTAAESLGKAYGFGSGDRQMGILPNYHSALSTYGFWPSFCLGSEFVLFKKFSKSNFWKNIEKYKIVFTETVPTILIMLMNPSEDVSCYNLDSLKFIGSGSATLLPEVHRKFEGIFGVMVCNKYGLTETEVTHFNPPQVELRKEGSIGKALPMCEVRVMKDDGSFCGPEETGEIVMRGDNVVYGYFNDEQETKKAFVDGWFHTGDMAYCDEDGFYFLVSRKKDIIIRGGSNIYPDEVDCVIFSHPDVLEAASFGVPDEIYGEEIVACVVLKKDAKTNEKNLMDYCEERIEKYKCPKKIKFIDKIPKTHSGKLSRRKLVEEIGGQI